jgi:hypothetical protein
MIRFLSRRRDGTVRSASHPEPAARLWCSRCLYRPDYSTMPATWHLVKADPECRVHGSSSDEKDGAGE